MPDDLHPQGSTPEGETPLFEATAAGGTPQDQAPQDEPSAAPAKKAAARKTAAKKAPAKKAAAKKTTAPRTATKKVAAAEDPVLGEPAAAGEPTTEQPAVEAAPAKKATARKAPAKKAAAKKTTAKKATARKVTEPEQEPAGTVEAETADETAAGPAAPTLLFQAPEKAKTPAKRTRKAATPKPEAAEKADKAEKAEKPEAKAEELAATAGEPAAEEQAGTPAEGKAADAKADAKAEDKAGEAQSDESAEGEETEGGGGRRRRRRGGRRRRKSGDGSNDSAEGQDNGSAGSGEEGGEAAAPAADTDQEDSGEGTSRRRRRRRRSGDDSGDATDDPQNTVTRVRKQRSAEDEITAVSGSTRLEAKKQRRREGREAGRRRAPIVSEAEFLARRESVDRVMAIRQREDLIQIGVLEDKVLVEHYVARESQTSLIGNVYIGRVQNVLPSMEAAFIDIGKGRNAVLYAGEVNWSALGHREGQPRKIESVLTSGQPVLVQVTKDPIGHKGARLTSQVSLAGRFLVYVPDGTTSGISRKLPDTERNRLKALLKEIVPDTAGVIVRTAAEGASEDELTRDVERLKARWEDIEKNSKSGSAPKLLYGEPDLTLKVVRDLFTEDFSRLVIQGDDAWDTVQGYVAHVAPDLEERLERFETGENGKDIFATYRIDEQIAKGLDRKVWLPSGGSLIIDRTEAMTVVDVNTGKFTGSGGNLEETVTKNNLEAAEEIVRQLRLRDIGGIIVVDFIDMVLESNRDLVLRRLVECLGRDRTRHQVAEVTSLGLVQMTRKRIGTGLLEAFSENCEHCQGRGLVIKDAPVEPKRSEDESRRSSSSRRSRGGGRGRGQEGDSDQGHEAAKAAAPSPKDVAAVAKPENAEKAPADQPGAAPAEPEKPAVAEPAAKEARAEKPVAEPTAKAARAEKPAVAEPTAPAEAPAAEEAAQPAPTEQPAPKVVTRTRRRAASRPAGQPTQQTAPQPVVVEAAPAAPVVAAEPAEPPKVVTRTRGRSASRPAGPPVGPAGAEQASDDGSVPSASVVETPPPGSMGSVGAPPAHGAVEPGTADSEPGPGVDGHHTSEDHHVEHVPIKKKGSRKR